MQVFKYIAPDPNQTAVIPMPVGSNIVHFSEQNGMFYFWAVVYPEENRVTRTFTTVGTGYDFPNGSAHRGTLLEGTGAWHLIELDPKPFT